jgi:hypothetical protein
MVIFLQKCLSKLSRFLYFIKTNFSNIVVYGWNCPKYSEIIFINPKDVKFVTNVAFNRQYTGRVVGGDWDKNCKPLRSINKISITYDYMDSAKNWKECGAYENMLNNPTGGAPWTLMDVIKRYEDLTQLIIFLKNGGIYKKTNNFNEIFVHIGRNGQLIFGGGGCHRLAVVQKLALKNIPAQIGVIHPEFLRNYPEKLCELRKRA